MLSFTQSFLLNGLERQHEPFGVPVLKFAVGRLIEDTWLLLLSSIRLSFSLGFLVISVQSLPEVEKQHVVCDFRKQGGTRAW